MFCMMLSLKSTDRWGKKGRQRKPDCLLLPPHSSSVVGDGGDDSLAPRAWNLLCNWQCGTQQLAGHFQGLHLGKNYEG